MLNSNVCPVLFLFFFPRMSRFNSSTLNTNDNEENKKLNGHLLLWEKENCFAVKYFHLNPAIDSRSRTSRSTNISAPLFRREGGVRGG